MSKDKKESSPKYPFNDHDVGLYVDELGNIAAASSVLTVIAGGVETLRHFYECPKCGYKHGDDDD